MHDRQTLGEKQFNTTAAAAAAAPQQDNKRTCVA